MSCTHCGLCLESCPTYTLWGTEADSPRGRIALIEDSLAPDGTVSAEMAFHVERCLGCMACMTACPEGVPFADLLVAARAAIDRELPRPVTERARRHLSRTALARSGRAAVAVRGRELPHHTPARGDPRGRVGLLLGCTQRARHRRIHEATLTVLSAEGYEVIAPRLPDCCGALELQAGPHPHALRRAQATIDAFAAVGGVDRIVSSAAGCGAAMKGYGHLLGTPQARAFSSMVRDVHELLLEQPPRSPLAPLALRVAVHDACALCHAQRAGATPRELLRRIPAIELLELPREAGACCGAPGLYPIAQPEASAALALRQARAVLEVAPDVVVSSDHACIAQLQRRLRALEQPLPVHHPIELLERSILAARPTG